MTRRSLCTTVVFLLVAFAATSLSQNANTSLRGVIKDPSGAVVPNAKIVLTDNATGRKLTATSGAAGEYEFLQIPPAKYNITVSAPGFGEQTKSAELLVNQPATIDFGMTMKASTEVVNVSAATQTLNTTDASLGSAMNNTLIQALPSEGRNVPDLLALQPGVLYLGQQSGRPANPDTANDPRSGSVNGGRSDQGNITVDGIDDNDQVNGYAFTGVLRQTQDSVEEFRVTTGLSGADEGRSSGAQVSMVTKSGTNKYHGSVYWYNRPTLTVANDWFNKEAQLSSGLPNTPPKLIRNNFGAAAGGPILKDKLFFFANYEALRQAENQIVSRVAPTASYQQGIINYQGDDASGNVVNSVITASQLATLDTPCLATGVCPWGPGANPNVLTYFNKFPAANGNALGDGGFNTGSFTFSSPYPVSLNTSIVRLDYIPGQKHHIFVRGNLQKDTSDGVEQFPGQGPSNVIIDNSKGITAGYTVTFTSNLVNDLRYGYIRQGFGNSGVGSGEYNDFRFMDPLTAETRSTIVSVPVNNIVDNLSWNKGRHTMQFGGNWRLIHQNFGTDENSFNSGTTNPYWLGGSPPDPSTIGGLPVDSGFTNSYVIAYANLVGTLPQITDVQNYAVSSATTGTLLPEAAFINRSFKTNEFEWYAQDSWRVLPKLTLSFGLRYTFLSVPWETRGQQVAPTIDTHAWYLQRGAAAAQGQIFENPLAFAPNGPFYSKPGFWPAQKDNFAPRLSVAYSPDPKTSIRAGFGMFYDHFGQSLVNTFSQQGSFGLSTQLSNPAGNLGFFTAPRFVNRNTLPNIPVPPGAPTQTFPFTYPRGNFAIQWGLDNRIKTPYSQTFNLSVQREIPAGFTVEANYIGRLGRHLLENLDIAEPVNYVDPQGGGGYFHAGAQLSALVDQNGGNFPAPVPAIQYFEDVFPYMANFDYPGESATQAIYNNEWAPYRSNLGATTALANLDFYCSDGPVNFPCPADHQSRFWQDQFSSLYVLSTIGMSYYNAGQLILRHPMSHGLSVDFSYTFANSIDMGSNAERGTEFNGHGGNFSNIINSWQPSLNRAHSDFDIRHLITANWVYELPFGHGRTYLNSSNAVAEALLGGWQWSGINRWASSLPFSLADPGWATNWQQSSNGVVTGKVKMQKHVLNGAPQVFADPVGINSGTATGGPVRLSYPGETGQRNNFRGDGFFSLDSGLAKAWQFKEYGALKFSWEVYNVTNSVRFNSNPITSLGASLTQGSLGSYAQMQNAPRRMQFGLRYDF